MRSRTRQGFGTLIPSVGGLGVGLQAALYTPQAKSYGLSWPLPVVADTSVVYIKSGSLLWRGHRYAAAEGTLSSGGWATSLRSGGMGSNWNTLTLAALLHITTTASSAGVYVASVTGGSFAVPAFLQSGGAGSNEFRMNLRAGSGTYYDVLTGDTTLKARFAVGRVRSDDKMDLWVDGAFVGQTTIARGGFNTAYAQANFLTAYYALYNKVAMAAVWNRWLSDSEVQALSRDPFALFANPDPLDGIDAQIVGSYQYARPNADIVTTGWSVV